MVTMLMVALAITTQDSPDRHVRTTEPKILSLIDAGLSHSATFRRLVATPERFRRHCVHRAETHATGLGRLSGP